MSPIKFNEQNCTYAENQKEYLPLPALKTEMGEVISCWKISLKDRLKLLLTGKLWVSVMTFNNPLQPMFFTINKKDLIEEKK